MPRPTRYQGRFRPAGAWSEFCSTTSLANWAKVNFFLVHCRSPESCTYWLTFQQLILSVICLRVSSPKSHKNPSGNARLFSSFFPIAFQDISKMSRTAGGLAPVSCPCLLTHLNGQSRGHITAQLSSLPPLIEACWGLFCVACQSSAIHMCAPYGWIEASQSNWTAVLVENNTER